MSYPPPPGLNGSQSNSSTPKPPSGLPARPPPPAGPPPPYTNNRSYGGFTAFQPRAVAAAAQQPVRIQSPSMTAGPMAQAGFSAMQPAYGNGGYQQPYQQPAPPSHYQPSSYQDGYAQPTPPQIKNPFAPPGQSAAGRFGAQAVDPEMEANIAQWQSAYVAKDEKRPNANATPMGVRPEVAQPTMSASELNTAAGTDSGVASIVTGADGKQKTVVRSGGGQTWQDSSLLEWDPTHFRLFVGNLAGEVTDESLAKAFSRYPSFEKARVVRDKRTTKSKGFGFVSFRDGDDYFQAAKEMQGKYIGSHPVLLRKSTTEIKATVPRDNKNKGKKGGNKGGVPGEHTTGAGIQKKQKTKGGLKILG